MFNFWTFLKEVMKNWWAKMIVTCLLIVIACVIQHFFPIDELLVPKTINTIESTVPLESIG